mgnify:CR=1 FL=1
MRKAKTTIEGLPIWRDFPNGQRVPGHHFFVGDLHGCLGHLEAALSLIEGLCPGGDPKRATLSFLGDYTDRGPFGMACFERAYACIGKFAKVDILPGNHEGTLVEILQGNEDLLELWGHKYSHWGGQAVMKELGVDASLPLPEQLRALQGSVPETYLRHFERAKSHVVYGDLIGVHAGILPSIAWGDYEAGLRDFLAKGLNDGAGLHWAWVGKEFLGWRGGWSDEKRLVVHGHSVEIDDPAAADDTLLRSVSDKILSHKRINLDLGAVFGGPQAVLEAAGGQYRIHLVRP